MSVPVEAIYTRARFGGGVRLFLLLLYTPLGLSLVILRLFISLQLFVATAILPQDTPICRFIIRVLYCVLGVIVQEKAVEKKDKTCRVLVANHITPFDHIAIANVLPCHTPSVYDFPSALSSLLYYRDLGSSRGREVVVNNAKAYIQTASTPLLLHPEGATTNGSVAVMKYATWAFSIDSQVLAIGLSVTRIPILDVAPSVLGASWAADLFFLMFSPFTHFTVRYLGRFSLQEGENVDDFAKSVQTKTAESLHLQVSNHTVADKVEYMKRLAQEAAANNSVLLSPEIYTMAQQVQEVLPYLPIDLIKKDLVRTWNVDVTITNFLEGNVPEPIPEPSYAVASTPAAPAHTVFQADTPQSSTSSSSITTSSPTPTVTTVTPTKSTLEQGSITLNMAAKTFCKSPAERMKSFQERKQQLIENARRKYIEKHDLKIPGYNC
ncbi:lipid droplet-regulating VLDL assembly factor AUP1-like [Oratosquilla oratoria]|uniref:lipid droplet-regulating VLDL assembly factor AUP1-like n=1 Tax=Oratosquilla oratoria TaxID=337810 RepID=UPI003F75E45E